MLNAIKQTTTLAITLLMQLLLRVLLSFLVLPSGLHAQFDKAFETPQPRRIKEFEQIREPYALNTELSEQIIAYAQLKALAGKHRDPQSALYAEACMASAEAKLDTGRLKDYVFRMRSIIQQSMSTDNAILQSRLLMMMVEVLSGMNRTGAALSYFVMADEIMNGLEPDETPRQYDGLKHDLIHNLYKIGDYQRAKEIMDKSVNVKKSPIYELLYTDLHSQILLQLNQYDSSAYYIMRARTMLDADTSGVFDKGWYGILEGNLAKIKYHQKEYASAIPSLVYAVDITYKAGLYDNTAVFGLLLADCYIRVHEPEKIRPLIPMIRQAVYLEGKDQQYIDLYRLMLAIPDGHPSPERTLGLLDSIDLRKKNLARLNDRNLLTKNEMEYELETYQERQAIMDAEIKRQLLWRNLLWAALGCAVCLALFVFYKGNKRFRLEQDRSRLIQERAENELAVARAQLQLFAATLQDKSRQIELLENNIDVSQQNEALEQLRQNTILTDDEWDRFKTLFEQAHPGFFARVKDKFPNLTTGEMRFLALVKLSFSTREMASTLGVSPVSVRSIRSRLLKKIDLADSENLGQLVSAI